MHFVLKKKYFIQPQNNEQDFLDSKRNDEFVGFIMMYLPFFYFCHCVHILQYTQFIDLQLQMRFPVENRI